MVVTYASYETGRLEGHTHMPEADCIDNNIDSVSSSDICTSISLQDPSLFQTRQALGKHANYIYMMPIP